MTKKVEYILVFRNGNIAAFDPDGNQIPELQKTTVPQMIAEWCQSRGYELDGLRLEASSLKFNGKTGQWEPVR